jgi:hypothetical protein
MGRGAPRVRLLDPARDNASTFRRSAVVVYMSTDSRTGGETLSAGWGAFTFASRWAYRLAYPCQREPVHYRDLRRAFKLRGKLGGHGGIGDYIPKPKWMRWPSYDRKLEKSSPLRRSSTPIRWLSSASLIAWDSDLVSIPHFRRLYSGSEKHDRCPTSNPNLRRIEVTGSSSRQHTERRRNHAVRERPRRSNRVIR